MLTKKVLFVLFLVPVLFCFRTTSAKASFGVSPADLTFDYLIPGMSVSEEFTISRTDIENEINIVIEPDTDEINDWFSFAPESSFSIPKGERTKKMNVTINVPTDATYKDYDGYLIVKTADDGESSGIGVLKGVGLAINLTVTRSEVSELFVRRIDIPDVGYKDPIIVNLITENYGNILTIPEIVTISVSDPNGNELFSAEDLNFEEIEPGRTKNITASFDHNLNLGEFKAKVSVYFEGKIIKESELVFNVSDEKPEKVVLNTIDDVNELFKIVLLSIIPISIFWMVIKRKYKK